MAKFNLSTSGGTDIQLSYTYDLTFPVSTFLGLNDELTCYVTSVELPSASGEAVIWHQTYGKKNHQAVKRTNKPISLEFVVPTTFENLNTQHMIERWLDATYNMNTGKNIGKAQYAVNGVRIRVMAAQGEKITSSYVLFKAFPTEVNFGTMSNESNELLKVSMTLVYDLYTMFDGKGNKITKD